jgi:hypothetical protein
VTKSAPATQTLLLRVRLLLLLRLVLLSQLGKQIRHTPCFAKFDEWETKKSGRGFCFQTPGSFLLQ